jgi:murein DD-endopeptidase MepM/ murein hydrolase activator NlpD
MKSKFIKSILLIKILNNLLSKIKDALIPKMFWGRSNFYKNLTFIIIFSLTLFISLSGIVAKISGNDSLNTLALSTEITTGQYDILQQGGSIETVLTIDPNIGIKFEKYIVKPGDTLEQIAKNFGVSIDTIRWASRDVLNVFTNEIKPGWELTIPPINGVLYTVKEGDSIQKIIEETGGNEFDIREFNELGSDGIPQPGDILFIPNGNFYRPDIDVAAIPRGIFISPLQDKSCAGYNITRGFLSYHNGVDLAKSSGCIISAVANGYVEYAGWSNYGQGYNVIIDHGGGIKTHYYHGNGTFWVQTGQRVQQGDPIMYMGTTGNSTGVHLHFSLFKDGVAVDPQPFVPY